MPKRFYICYKSGFKNLCRAKDFELEHFLALSTNKNSLKAAVRIGLFHVIEG
jgi:hypothetical protein